MLFRSQERRDKRVERKAFKKTQREKRIDGFFSGANKIRVRKDHLDKWLPDPAVVCAGEIVSLQAKYGRNYKPDIAERVIANTMAKTGYSEAAIKKGLRGYERHVESERLKAQKEKTMLDKHYAGIDKPTESKYLDKWLPDPVHFFNKEFELSKSKEKSGNFSPDKSDWKIAKEMGRSGYSDKAIEKALWHSPNLKERKGDHTEIYIKNIVKKIMGIPDLRLPTPKGIAKGFLGIDDRGR